MRHLAFPGGVTRDALVEWYRRTRARTRSLFERIPAGAYYTRPIPLRNPFVFYEGHLPAFAVNTLVKLTLGRDGVDAQLESLFARGIDPESEAAMKSPADAWPSRDDVRAYADRAEALVERTLGEDGIEETEAAFTIIEHELMHQETLIYMMAAAVERGALRSPIGVRRAESPPLHSERVAIPAGRATLGMPRGAAFGWDNEFAEHVVDVPPFEIDIRNVTNAEYAAYMEATGAEKPHFFFEANDAPVYVTHAEATAYAKWKGARLPAEAEYHRAAFGTPSGEERMYPWGEELPDATRGNFDFASWEPVAAGSFPEGASAWGVLDLVGNGWEWTSTLFAPFPGFQPMPSYKQYSADFFDNAHYVLKGASPVTPRELVRRSFRNWFRPNYPYVFATFRCAR